MLKLYHGSNVVIDKIDLCLSRKGKDFGCGFYLNPNESQAREMAVRTAQRLQEGMRHQQELTCLMTACLWKIQRFYP